MSKTVMPKTVMIVEDNALNLKLFDDLVQVKGYNTVLVTEGREVLALARARQPDLILMDIQLPDISGFELIQMLKQDQTLRHIPVVAVTALAFKEDEDRIRAAGCDGYVPKPVAVHLFFETLGRFLE